MAMLLTIWRRGRRYGEQARQWYAFIFIAILTLAYYAGVFIDIYVRDFMNSGDVSSMVRMAVLVALLLFVIYAPHREREP